MKRYAKVLQTVMGDEETFGIKAGEVYEMVEGRVKHMPAIDSPKHSPRTMFNWQIQVLPDEFVEVKKIAVFDSHYKIEKGGVYQVAKDVPWHPKTVTIVAPSGENRTIWRSQIVPVNEKGERKMTMGLEYVRINSAQVADKVYGIEVGDVHEVIGLADHGVYIGLPNGRTHLLLNHQIEFVPKPDDSPVEVVHGLDMGHGQVTEGKRTPQEPTEMDHAKAHLESVVEDLKNQQRELDKEMESLDKRRDELKEKKKHINRKMTHHLAVLEYMEVE